MELRKGAATLRRSAPEIYAIFDEFGKNASTVPMPVKGH